MNFLKLSTMQYPIHEGNIRLEYPEIREDQTGDTFPLPADYVQVEQTPKPTYSPKTQYLTQSAPVENNGIWQSVWVVNDMTAEQIADIAKADAEIPRPHRPHRPPLTNSGSTPNVIT